MLPIRMSPHHRSHLVEVAVRTPPMLTNLTNLTRSATQTLLTNGTRSLDLVVNVNMATVSVSRSRHRSLLHVERFMLSGKSLKPIDPNIIWDNGFEMIPCSPPGVARPDFGRSQLSESGTWGPSESKVWRSDQRSAMNRRRVDQPGQRAGYSARDRAPSSAMPPAQTTSALKPRKVPARLSRTRLLGG